MTSDDIPSDHAGGAVADITAGSMAPDSATTPSVADSMAASVMDSVMDSVIEAYGVRRRYAGGFEAVAGVSFSVARGELFALLGTNGAGKTSTVELLEGLARPDAGTVRVLGHDPYRERAAVRPRIGVMLQEGGFPSELTVTETVRMWAGCTSGARPTGEALDLVGLSHRARVRVKQLSGGERRRSTSRRPCSAGPRCCSSTSRPPHSTPKDGATPGSWYGSCATTASPSCSPRTTWRRPRRSPTGRRSCTGGGS